MNPEAAQWLESLPEVEHMKMFSACIPSISAGTPREALFTVKEDHERCLLCRAAGENLLVVE